jgi:hypothetical protein
LHAKSSDNAAYSLSLMGGGIPICGVSAHLPHPAIVSGAPTERPAMFTPERFRAKAAEFRELAKTANSPDEARAFAQREASFIVLADNEQWLADHHGQTVQAGGEDGTAEATPVLCGDAAAQQ